MISHYLVMKLEDLQAVRDALVEHINEQDPLRGVAFTHMMWSPDIPTLAEIDKALEILKRAREKLLDPQVRADGSRGQRVEGE